MPDRALRETVIRYRAPEEDGGVFVHPDWAELGTVVQTNQARLSQAGRYDCQGKRLGDLARQARQQLLQQAWQWTRSYRSNLCPADPSEGKSLWVQAGLEENKSVRIFLSGHQPQLFHPGVWLKNFALDRLARLYGAVGVNLIVDHDTPRSMVVRTPTGTPNEPKWTEIPLDGAAPGVAYEDRPVVDWQVFEAFGQRVLGALAELVPAPMIGRFWPVVLERARATGRLGSALAQARHLWEIRWGSRTWEAPFSRLCQGEAFLWFAVHLAAQLPLLHKHYNTILGEYRRQHRIRNPAQPVPNLRAEDGWLEAPLWIWTQQAPVRRPLYLRPGERETLLSDRGGWEQRLPITAEGDLTRAVGILQEWADGGVRIRPRALAVTLWIRLALADLFIHGIGGARYDQITDELIRRFFGLEPPGFFTLSGTLYLPVERPRGIREKWLDLHKQFRELLWHPERFFHCPHQAIQTDGTSSIASDGPEALAAEKWRWIHSPVSRENARSRFLAIRRINQTLQSWLTEVQEKLLAEKAHLEALMQAEKILGWRDWPFCFYPERSLREFFAAALPDFLPQPGQVSLIPGEDRHG